MADATVNVKITDVKPFAGFVRDVAAAHVLLRHMSPAQIADLPATAVQGMDALRAALRKIAPED